MNEFFRKLSWLTQRRKKEAELRAELIFHLEEEAAGLAIKDAESAARRELGNIVLVMEDTRRTWGWASLEQFWQDLRYSLRSLRKTPGFATAAILSLAFGIGANTAIFTLLNAVILRLLPVNNPHQLVQLAYTLPLWETNPNNWNSWFGYPQFERFKEQSKSLDGIFGGTRIGRVSIAFGPASELAIADAYSGSFFSVLGLTSQHGRLFTQEDDRPDASVAVLSDRCWRTQFAADPSIIGGAVTINQIPFTVIGVTPPEFAGISLGNGPDVWIPLRSMDRLKPNKNRWQDAFSSWMLLAGRLRAGASREQAQAELDTIHRQLLMEYLSASELRNRENMQRFARETHLLVRPAANGTLSGIREGYSLPLKLLMCVAGIVLLVACANVANLLLARASSRRREIATKLALGAGRGRVVRQFLTESLVLASLGGALALAFAWWGSIVLVRMISTGESPVRLDVQPDWRVFGFTAAVSLLTGILFGMAPALRTTRIDPAPAMKEGSRDTGRTSHTLDRILVVTQVALSVVLITGAGLFVRTLQKLWSANLGYERENIFMVSVDAQLAGYGSDRAGMIYAELLRRLRGLPGVQSGAASVVRPLDDHFYLIDRVEEIDGRKLPERDAIRVAWNATSPGYFGTISTPFLLGRDFTSRDDESAERVVIINESLANKAFPQQNPIGHRLSGATVIGVVKDSHYNGVRDQPRPVLFHPLFQHGKNQEYQWGFVSFELRSRMRPSLLDEVRREVTAVDRNLPVFRARTLRSQTEQSLLKERLLAMLSTFFGALSLILACLGLYGLMAYAVARRTSEIGIRMALGARRDHILWMVLRETLLLTLIGIAAGIPLALFAARYAKSLLFEVNTTDPVTIVLTVATLAGVAAFAAYLPAMRAVRVEPMTALRYE